MNSWTKSCCVTSDRLNIQSRERMTMANRDNYRTRERAKQLGEKTQIRGHGTPRSTEEARANGEDPPIALHTST